MDCDSEASTVLPCSADTCTDRSVCVCVQVRGACYSLHHLFIACPPGQRLAVIAADRSARAHAAERRRTADPAGRLSQATVLTLQRRRR